MKVFQGDGYDRRLVGRAEVPEWSLPLLEVKVNRNGQKYSEAYTVGTVNCEPNSSTGRTSERAVLVSDQQDPAWLPGWQKLDS